MMMKIVTVLENQACKACKGSGKSGKDKKCKTCNGSGKVEVEVLR